MASEKLRKDLRRAVLEAKAGWFERLLIRLLRAAYAYRQRLRAIVAELLAEMVNKISGEVVVEVEGLNC